MVSDTAEQHKVRPPTHTNSPHFIDYFKLNITFYSHLNYGRPQHFSITHFRITSKILSNRKLLHNYIYVNFFSRNNHLIN